MTTFLQFAVLGLGAGATYALAAQSLVLVYRGSGVINFAQGGMAMIGAYAYDAGIGAGWGSAYAITAGLIAAGGGGALTHVLVMRFLDESSALARVVATLAVLTVIQAAVLLKYGDAIEFVPALLPQGNLDVSGVPVAVDRLWLVALSATIAAALALAYRRTRLGLATTAVAENRRVAASLGISPHAVATVNWTLGGMLSGAAGILVVPLIGLSVSHLGMLLVPALAAALVGSFTSFGITWIAGILIGVGEALTTLYTSAPGWSNSIPLLVIVAVLMVRGKAIPIRGYVGERLPAVGTGRAPLGLLAGLAASSVVALILLDDAAIPALTMTCVTGILCLSLTVVSGYAGQLSLAQYAFAGVGAYVAARTSALIGMPFWAALLIGTLSPIPVGLAIGLPSLRTRGVALGIATLALGLVVERVLLGNPDYTGGFFGTTVRSPELLGLSLDPIAEPKRYAFLCLIALGVVATIVAGIRRGRLGRRLLAIRSNEQAAAALGLPVLRLKLLAFSTSAALAGLGGTLIAFQTPHVVFNEFGYGSSINLILVAVLGGIGYVGGALLGGLAVTGGLVSYELSQLGISEQWLLLWTGIAVLFFLVRAPDGGMSQLTALGQRVVRRRPPSVGAAAARRGGTAAAVPPKTVELVHVSVRFGSVLALDDVSLRVGPGEIVGLVGPNGAGKSTIIDVVSGASRPDTGRVRIDGEGGSRLTRSRRARDGVSRTFQTLELFEDLTVGDNMAVAATSGGAWATFVLEQLALASEVKRFPRELSYGHRRLLAVARAVSIAPSILLLDEPAAGLDEVERARLESFLDRAAHSHGMAVLMAEHDAAMIERVCDRVLAVDAGRAGETGVDTDTIHDGGPATPPAVAR
jgi:branched-subunit amino acid ABC-type transport system permease component/ABC-type branched-subunit amino acid transport system ATPase component